MAKVVTDLTVVIVLITYLDRIITPRILKLTQCYLPIISQYSCGGWGKTSHGRWQKRDSHPHRVKSSSSLSLGKVGDSGGSRRHPGKAATTDVGSHAGQ